MSAARLVHRREILRWLAALGAVGLGGPARAMPTPELDAATRAGRLRDRLSNPGSAAVLGAVYLRERPAEASVAWLTERLGLAESSGRDEAAGIAERHREDLRSGRSFTIEGFSFSLTELRLCALLHLVY